MVTKRCAIVCTHDTAAMPADRGNCAGRGQRLISRHGGHWPLCML